MLCWTLLAAAIVWGCLAAFDLAGQRRLFHVGGEELLSDYDTPRMCAIADDAYHPGVVKDVDACYPAIAYAIVRAFPEGHAGGVLLTGLMTAAFLLALLAIRRDFLAVSVCAFSAPMLFTIERGNLVILAAAGVAFFIAFYDSPRKGLRVFAAFALAAAAALKITPAVFAVLYLFPSRTSDNQLAWRLAMDVRSLLLFAAFSAALFIIPFLFFGGIPDGLVSWFGNAKQNSSEYALATRWGFVALGRAIHHALGHDVHSVWIGYAACRVASITLGTVCLLAAGRIRWNRVSSPIADSHVVFLLASSMLLLSPPMHFYTGLYLLPAFVLRIGVFGRLKFDILEAILWLLMLLPLQVPFGASSLNTPLVAAAHLVLVVECLLRRTFVSADNE